MSQGGKCDDLGDMGVSTGEVAQSLESLLGTADDYDPHRYQPPPSLPVS